MNAITTRAVKGSPLSFAEMDANLDALALAAGRVVDLRARGAKGDSNGIAGNGTDNDAIINATVAEVGAAGGGVIWVPPGIFRIAKPRTRIAYSNVILAGAPGSYLFYDSDDIRQYGGVLFDGYTSSGGVLTPGVIRNVGVRGLGIFRRAGVVSDLNGAVDPLGGDSWGAQACLVTMRGCRRFAVAECDIFQGPSWAVNVYDCRDGRVTDNSIHDMIADGVHVQAGSRDVLVARNTIENVGDDGLAVGFSNRPDVNRNIRLIDNTVTGTGSRGIAIYGPSAGVTASGNVIDTTWLSGLQVVGLSIIADNGSTYTYGPAAVGDVVIGPNIFRNIGARSPTLYNRGIGEAFGILVDPVGGTVSRVAIAAGQSFYNVRNAFVAKTSTGTISNLLLAPGSVYDTLVAGGAGASSQGGGNSRDPDGTHSAVAEYAGGAATPAAQTILFSDDMERADGALANGYTVANGSAAITSKFARFAQGGNFPNASRDVGASDLDISIDVVPNGSDVRLYARQASGIELAMDTSGYVYYYDGQLRYIGSGFPSMDKSGTASRKLRMVVKGNVVTCYIGGNQVLTGSPNVQMVTTKTAGFGESDQPNPGAARFKNFVVKTAA